MRIIIAGGTGLIGRELSLALAKRGDYVTILSRTPSKMHNLPKGVKAVQWDGKNLGDWQNEIENTDVLINLTGENLSGKGILPSRWTNKRRERIRRSRVDSGKVLTEAIRLAKKKPATFVQASGINYYEPDTGKKLTEESPVGNDFLSKLCIEWEASSKPIETQGVRRIIVRNGIVLSSEHGALLPLILQFKLFAGGTLGSGRQMYSWIHIDDEIQAILFLIDHEIAKGVFNLTSPYPVSNRDFGRAIGKVLKRPFYLPIPGIFMKIAFGEVASLVLEGRAVLPMRLLEMGYQFKFPDISDALKDLLKK